MWPGSTGWGPALSDVFTCVCPVTYLVLNLGEALPKDAVHLLCPGSLMPLEAQVWVLLKSLLAQRPFWPRRDTEACAPYLS